MLQMYSLKLKSAKKLFDRVIVLITVQIVQKYNILLNMSAALEILQMTNLKQL